MQPAVATSSRTLEFAPPCKQLSLIQIIVYLLSFSLTWYRVWWDSILGLFVAVFGYYVLRDTNGQSLNLLHVHWFYRTNIMSMASHLIALAVTLYYMLQGRIFNDVIGVVKVHENVPGWVFFGFLLTLLGIEITLTAFTIWRGQSLLAEIERNSVLKELTHGGARV